MSPRMASSKSPKHRRHQRYLIAALTMIAIPTAVAVLSSPSPVTQTSEQGGCGLGPTFARAICEADATITNAQTNMRFLFTRPPHRSDARPTRARSRPRPPISTTGNRNIRAQHRTPARDANGKKDDASGARPPRHVHRLPGMLQSRRGTRPARIDNRARGANLLPRRKSGDAFNRASDARRQAAWERNRRNWFGEHSTLSS